jgi:hypothetical protein
MSRAAPEGIGIHSTASEDFPPASRASFLTPAPTHNYRAGVGLLRSTAGGSDWLAVHILPYLCTSNSLVFMFLFIFFPLSLCPTAPPWTLFAGLLVLFCYPMLPIFPDHHPPPGGSPPSQRTKQPTTHNNTIPLLPSSPLPP